MLRCAFTVFGTYFAISIWLAYRAHNGYNQLYMNETTLQSSIALDVQSSLSADIRARGLTYHINSYGCQMNAHDSEHMAGMLERMGYTPAASQAEADCIVFNTCCVREHAEKRVFGNIGALKEQKERNPRLIIAVCGCMTQQKAVAEKLYRRFPFVDIIMGTDELSNFPAALACALNGKRELCVGDAMSSIPEGLPVVYTSSYAASVNIMYGCNNFCTYCIVPYVRGRERSRRPEDILGEARALADKGYKELTLLGQNVNSYNGGITFPELLRLLDAQSGIPRLRFMTSHPKDLSPELIDAMAELPSVCNHIHLPVQSGSDRILAAMNRRYDREKYLSLVSALRNAVPDIGLTTDIIVGFPSETDADFADTIELVREAGFAAAFTFMYSKRTGTKAAAMQEQIPPEIKKQRLHELNAVQAEVLRGGNAKYVGSTGNVLVEGCDHRGADMAYGKLGCFKMVYFPGGEELIGSLQNVRITSTKNNSLIGERI